MTDDADARWASEWMGATHRFAVECARFRDNNPTDSNALEEVIVFLATELFDWRFSVTEIRDAFAKATRGLEHYAGGEERRGEKL